MSARSALVGLIGALVLVASGAAWWASSGDPEPTAAVEADTDGLSEQEQREMLQEIGYLK